MSTPYQENNKMYEYAYALNETVRVVENMKDEILNENIGEIIQPQLQKVQLLSISLPYADGESFVFILIRDILNSLNSFLCLLIYEIEYLNQENNKRKEKDVLSRPQEKPIRPPPPLQSITIQDVDAILIGIFILLYIVIELLTNYYIEFASSNGIEFTLEQGLYILSEHNLRPSTLKSQVQTQRLTVDELKRFIQCNNDEKIEFIKQYF